METRHKRSSRWLGLLLLLGVALGCARLPGPRDKGGISLVLAVKADQAQMDQSIERTIAVIETRCDQLGLYCKLQRGSGDKANQLTLHVSGSMEPGRVKSVLLAEGLELRAVVSPPMPNPVQLYATQAEAAVAAGKDNDVLPYLERAESAEGARATGSKFLVLERTPIVTGQDVSRAAAVNRTGAADAYQIAFTLNPEGASRFGTWTGANINNYIAVVLNKEVRSVAYIKSQITDSGEISGRFNKQQADDTARILMSGNLPAPVELLSEGTYTP